MARPKKSGMDYFPHDVHLSSDNKFQCVEALHGLTGYAVCVKLFEIAYQDSSGCVSIPDDEALLILSNRFRLSPEITLKIIQTAIKYNLFDNEKWDAEKKLTSNGIQRRISEVDALRDRWRKKTGQQIQPPASLVGVISVDNPEGNAIKKRKVKESKEKKRKEKIGSEAADAGHATDGKPVQLAIAPAANPEPTPAQRGKRNPVEVADLAVLDRGLLEKEFGPECVEFYTSKIKNFAADNPKWWTASRSLNRTIRNWIHRDDQKGLAFYPKGPRGPNTYTAFEATQFVEKLICIK